MNPAQNRDVILGFLDQEDIGSEAFVSGIKLSLRNEQEIKELAQSINESNTIQVFEFGEEAAVEVSEFSNRILGNFQVNEMEDYGNIMKKLDKILARFNKKDFKKKIGGLFGRIFNTSENLLGNWIVKYQTIGMEIEKIYIDISKYQNELSVSTKRFERMYEEIFQSYLRVEKYIVAAEMKLNELNTSKYPQLKEKAQGGDLLSSLDLEQLKSKITILEKRILHLEMAKVVSLQMASHLKLLQRGNKKLFDKINSSFITAIPIFKNGLNQAVAAKRKKLVAESMRQLDHRTKEILLWNVDNPASSDISRMINGSSIKIEMLEESMKIIKKGLQETTMIEQRNKRLREEDALRLQELQENFIKLKRV